MNPYFSWINDLSRNATVWIFGKLGTSQTTLDSFTTVSKQIENDEGNLTLDQWTATASEDAKIVASAFSWVKIIVPLALVIAAIWGVGRLREMYK